MRPLQIGITGGIGSGKTLVCKIFATLGIPVYDADSRAKALMTTDGILISAIKKEFGELSYKTDNTLDREYLGRTVFNHEERLQTLNNLVHPRVAEDYEGWVTRQQTPYVLKEAALLFEAGSYKALDRIIVVSAPLYIRIRRVLGRDRHRTEEQVRDIISRQLPEEEKVRMADFVIYNDESQLVITQVLELHHKFSTMQMKRTQ
ncbi:MAG TPA: dephospho-CoA kinase [Ohtaekwangia sp.]|nr:dephospho-CoA kinase [Ohtaekwangia sp.]